MPPEMRLESGLAYIDFAVMQPYKYHLMFNLEPSNATSGDQRSKAMSALLEVHAYGIKTGDFILPGGCTLEAAAIQCWATVHGIAYLLPTVLADEHEKIAFMARLISGNTGEIFNAVPGR